MKNDHFLVYLAVWVLFPKFLGIWGSSLYLYACIRIAWNDKSATFSCIPNEFYFAFCSMSGAKSAENNAFLDFYCILGFSPNIWGKIELYLC